MNRKEKIGFLSALIVLVLGSFGLSPNAWAEEYTAGDTMTIDEKHVINVKNMTQDEKKGSLSLGFTATADGKSAFAVGNGVTAQGENAVAFGLSSTAQGDNASAFGISNRALKEKATAFGYNNTASGRVSSAFGYESQATGSYATSFGFQNKASETLSAAFGIGNTASAKKASAFGGYNTAAAENATAAGQEVKVYGQNSASFGYMNVVGAVIPGDDGKVTVDTEKGNNTYVFGGNNTVTANNAVVVGTGVTGTVGDGAVILGTNITGNVAENSVVIGNGSTSEEENTVSVGSTEVTRRIVHVADGTENTDAATFGQIVKNEKYTVSQGSVTIKTNADGDAFTITGLGASADIGDTKKLADAGLGDNVTDSVISVNNKVGVLSDDVKKIGAGAAALAALRLEAFNPDDKWSFAVGYGHYKNANAGALGVFFKPNEDTTVSFGGTLGYDDALMNAGVSFKLGSRGKVLLQSVSNSQLVQEVNALRAQNAEQENKIASQAKEIRELKAQMAQVFAKLGE